MKLDELEEEFLRLLDDLSASLASCDVSSINELIRHDEMGVAFENLCVQLVERDILCTPEQRRRMGRLDKILCVDSRYLALLDRDFDSNS